MQDIADLISLSLLQLDPRITESRDTLWRSLIETALYYENKPLSADDIAEAVSKLLEQPELNLPDELNKAIQGCIERGSIAREGELLVLSEVNKARIEEAMQQYQSDEKDFDKSLIECVEKELGSTLDDKLSLLHSSVKYALEEMFRTRSVEMERRLSRKSCKLEDIIKAGSSYDLAEGIKDKLKPVTTLLGGSTEEQIMRGIRQHFKEPNDSSKRYVSRLYLKVFYHQILNLDPSLHQHERDYFSKTRLYLDTNALVAYLFEADLLHNTTVDVIDSSRRLGIQIMISPATLKEMEYQVEKAQGLFSSLGNDSRIMRLIVETRQGEQSNPIIGTFGMRVKNNPSLLWSSFIFQYADMEDYLLQKLILVEKESYDAVRDEENYHKVWQTIRSVRHESVSDEVVYHDSDNLVLIHLLRQQHRPHPMGHTVWLGTWDSSLRVTDRRLARLYSSPHSKMIDEWGEVIMPFQNINNFIYTDYILFLVRSKLGIALDVIALDLDFLEPFHRPEFEVDALLELDDSQYVAKILAGLQTKREMRELSDRARAAETAEEIVEINRQLAPHLLEAMVSDKEAAEEKSKELLRKTQELEGELAQKEKIMTKLTERVHEIESRTIWQKLKALIGLKK